METLMQEKEKGEHSFNDKYRQFVTKLISNIAYLSVSHLNLWRS